MKENESEKERKDKNVKFIYNVFEEKKNCNEAFNRKYINKMC